MARHNLAGAVIDENQPLSVAPTALASGAATSTGQDTLHADLVNLLTQIVLAAGNAHLGQVGGHTVPVTASKTRPNDTDAYAANDALAESASAGTVWTFTGAARISGGSGVIVAAQVKCTNPANVARLEVDLYDSAPNAARNDNAEATQLVADIGKFIGTLTLPALAKKTANSTFAIARDNSVRLPFKASGSADLIGIVRTLDAFTPTAQSIYHVTLDVIQD